MATMTQADRERYGTAEVRRLVRGRSYEEVVAIRDGMIAQAKLATMKDLPEDEALRQFEAVLAGAYDEPVAVYERHPLDDHDEIELARQLDVMTNARVNAPAPSRSYEQVDPADPNGPVTAEEVELSRQLDALIGG